MRFVTLVVFLAIFTLSAGLRFYNLGDWSFAHDELATFTETDGLFDSSLVSQESQFYRLPRIIPLGYAIQKVGFDTFGRDEYHSRILHAGAGVLGICIIFWGLLGMWGLRAAAVASLTIAVWPTHLFQSQQTRFYIFAWLFAICVQVFGALALHRRSFGWMMAACVCCILAVLTHTVLAVLAPGLLVVTLLMARGSKNGFPKREVIAILITCGLIGLYGFLHVRPLMSGWNSGETWGYDSLHSMKASFIQIGWPTVGIGLFAMYWARREGDRYWPFWGLLSMTLSAVLPKFVAYHPSYSFPFSTPIIMLGGWAFAKLCPERWDVSICLLAAFLTANLPGLLGHLEDGSRPDHRTAALYVASQMQPDDRLAAASTGYYRHYANFGGEMIPFSQDNPIPALEKAIREPNRGRLWIIVVSYRGGKSVKMNEWLSENAKLKKTVRRFRYDYPDHVVEVYLAEK
jgi:hypothetical protein